MQTAMGMLSTITKVIKSLLLQLFEPYHHMIMGPPEESVESQHSYCLSGDKTWCKYHKDKIFNRNIYDRSKCLKHLCFAESFMSTWAHSKSERVH